MKGYVRREICVAFALPCSERRLRSIRLLHFICHFHESFGTTPTELQLLKRLLTEWPALGLAALVRRLGSKSPLPAGRALFELLQEPISLLWRETDGMERVEFGHLAWHLRADGAQELFTKEFGVDLHQYSLQYSS